MLVGLLAFVALALTACLGELTPSGRWAAPVQAGEWIYVATSKGDNQGSLIRVSAKTGERVDSWQFPGKDEKIGVIYGTPLVTDDAVYVAAYTCRGNVCAGNVFAVSVEGGEAIRIENGKLISVGSGEAISVRSAESVWGERTFPVATEIVGALALHENTLIFGTSQVGDSDETPGYLYALDSTPDSHLNLDERVSARLKWRFPVGGTVWSSPTIVDGIAYFGAMDGFVYAVDLTVDITGVDQSEREVWRFEAGGAVAAQPVIVGEKLYIGDFEGHFYALDLGARRSDRTGSTLDPTREWRFETDSWFWAPALVDGEVVYASTLGGTVFALDAKTGRALWPEPGRVEGQIIASPALIQTDMGPELAVPSGDEDVWKLDVVFGQDRGKFDTADAVKAAPMVVGELIYVHTLDRKLTWFSIKSRAKLGCLEIPSGEQCSP